MKRRAPILLALLAAVAALALDWREVAGVRIPEGDAVSVAVDGETVWSRVSYDAEVEYVESTGAQWVETDYVPTAGSFAVDMTALPPWRSGFMIYFGAYVSNNNRLYATNQSGGTENIAWQYGTARHGTTAFPSVTRGRTDYTFAGNTHPFRVFYMGNSPTAFYPANARFRSARFWGSQGALALDLVPVRIGTEGALFDKVSGRVFKSATETPLVAGPDK